MYKPDGRDCATVFVHALKNPTLWLKVFLQIQSILNNIFSLTTGKTSNKVAYGIFLWRPLDLFNLSGLSAVFYARADVTNTISFTLANQKIYYNRKH